MARQAPGHVGHGEADVTTGAETGTQADSVSELRRESAERSFLRRLPPIALVLVSFALVALFASGWAFLEVTRGGSSGSGASASTTEPVVEVPVGDRGEQVQLSGTTLTGDALDVVDLRGDVVVVNVWGSWCVPCREEAPTLARVSVDYAGQGVQFVGVNIKDNRAAALAFEERYGITYPSIEDRDGRAMLALSRYVPAQAVPVTLVLDRDGRVASRVIGVVREATLRSLLDTTLAEGPAL